MHPSFWRGCIPECTKITAEATQLKESHQCPWCRICSRIFKGKDTKWVEGIPNWIQKAKNWVESWSTKSLQPENPKIHLPQTWKFGIRSTHLRLWFYWMSKIVAKNLHLLEGFVDPAQMTSWHFRNQKTGSHMHQPFSPQILHLPKPFIIPVSVENLHVSFLTWLKNQLRKLLPLWLLLL